MSMPTGIRLNLRPVNKTRKNLHFSHAQQMSRDHFSFVLTFIIDLKLIYDSYDIIFPYDYRETSYKIKSSDVYINISYMYVQYSIF